MNTRRFTSFTCCRRSPFTTNLNTCNQTIIQTHTHTHTDGSPRRLCYPNLLAFGSRSSGLHICIMIVYDHHRHMSSMRASRTDQLRPFLLLLCCVWVWRLAALCKSWWDLPNRLFVSCEFDLLFRFPVAWVARTRSILVITINYATSFS